jgi:hypothetical protein
MSRKCDVELLYNGGKNTLQENVPMNWNIHELILYLRKTYPQIAVHYLTEFGTKKLLYPWDKVRNVHNKIMIEYTDEDSSSEFQE